MPDIESKSIRVFIAMPTPAAVREQLRRLQVEWRGRLGKDGIRWTDPNQMHVTLRFLGQVPEDDLPGLIQAIRGACSGAEPFQLRAERVGFFPHARSPRVIWAWVHDDRGHLQQLQRAVMSSTLALGDHEENESFTGHLTIGRVRRLKPAQTRTLADLALAASSLVFGDWTAGTVELMRSDLSTAGSQHTSLATIPLTGGRS